MRDVCPVAAAKIKSRDYDSGRCYCTASRVETLRKEAENSADGPTHHAQILGRLAFSKGWMISLCAA
eukprot:scaffold56_cov20-Prasinocladus_malaysianus.AAC.1